MNITGSRDGKVFFIDDDKVMIDGKMYYEKDPKNLAQPDAYSLLADVLAEIKARCVSGNGNPIRIYEGPLTEILSKYFS